MSEQPVGAETSSDAISAAIGDLQERMARIEKVLERQVEWAKMQEAKDDKP